MNLCGDFVNVTTEQEMVMELPESHFAKYDEKRRPRGRRRSGSGSRSRGVPTYVGVDNYSASRRRDRSSSRGRSRRSGRSSLVMRSSDSESFGGPGLLNPISKGDFIKSRSRNQKMPSGTIKKLEEGFYLKFLTEDNDTRNTNLQLEHDHVHLRIRCLDKDLSLRKDFEEDSENNGSKSNFADIRLKVQDLAGVEMGADKYSASKGSSRLSMAVNGFAIVMKKSIADSNTFFFESDSQTERDEITGALKGLIIVDQPKYTEDSSKRRRNRTLHSEAMENLSSHRRKDLGGYKSGSSRRSRSERAQRSIDFTAETRKESSVRKSRTQFPILEEGRDEKMESNDIVTGSDDDRVIATCSQRLGKIEIGSNANVDQPRTSRNCKKGPKTRESSTTKVSGEIPQDQELSITVLENEPLRDLSVEVAGFGFGIDDILCGRKARSGLESPVADANKDSLSTDEMKTSLSSGCHPFSGCQSQALAAVEDAEMAAMANQIANPWCTDDICNASLKDFSDTMKGIFELKQKEKTHGSMTEEYMSGALGRQTAMTTLQTVKEIWNPAPKHRSMKKRRILNRVAQSGGQARRLSQMRNKMTFNAAMTTKKMPFLQVASSFDDINVAERWGAGKQAAKTRTTDELDGPQDFFDKVVGISSSDNDKNEDLYYDSDPGDIRERTHTKGPRRVIADIKTIHARQRARREVLSGIDMTRLLQNRRRKKADDETITEVIENMKNETIRLIWHPTQTKSTRNLSPVCVKARIESGVYLIDGTFLLPKLAWLPYHEDGLHSRQLNIGKSKPETLDLLDVCRVRACNEINRKQHPYAPSDRSFVVQTQNGLYLFETESSEERNRLVVGLKLVIARLASLLMLRDLRAVDEFFGGNNVPGEAPAFASNKKERDQNPEFPTNIS